MNEKDLFILSEQALTKVVKQIKPEQWSQTVSPEVSPRGGDLRTLINYHAYDDAWVPETLAGKTIAEVGSKYDGDLLGDDPMASWQVIVDKAIAAVKEADLTRLVHLTYGDYPAHDYLWHITTFRTFRTVTLARFIGADETLPPELITGLMKILVLNGEFLREAGIFGKEIEISDDATPQEKLLAFAGTNPHHS